ncbi:MAG: hypothetical protein J5529_13025 [Prevotella sp.]|nr:hypothetical protein [Prevotella sp.]
MKHINPFIRIACLFACLAALAACSDFWDPETEDEFNGEEGFTSNTEMYTGFLGIMTKMQEIGDKEILLTETRGELIEPADESTNELIALYNYDQNLQTNSYANPQGYYEVIIACNDYLSNMREYKSRPNVNVEAWEALVASALRVKVWTYKTLAEIYGKAVWFDDPITEVTDIKTGDKFQMLPLEQLIDKCITTLDQGFDGVASDKDIDWYEWLDPTHSVSLASSQYRKWNYMSPPYAGLYAELCLWKGATLDAANQDATAWYKKAADILLLALGKQINVTSDPGSNVYWLPSAATPGHYSPIWNNNQPYPYEAVAAIIYDYTNNQTNTLLKHFSNEYPNKYLLRPSENGKARFTDAVFNPGATTSDTRYKCVFGNSSGQDYIAKFRPVGSTARVNAYQDDCHIYLYRATQYHIMLCEALNHLKRFIAMNAVFNSGVKAGEADNCFHTGMPEWEGFASTIDPTKCDWTGTANWGTRRYPSMGIRGCFTGLVPRDVKENTHELGETGTFRFNDMAILDEAMLEFAAEGKVYPLMNRMAVRYNDPAIVADRVCAKYSDAALAAAVRSKIMSGANWVPFDLQFQ